MGPLHKLYVNCDKWIRSTLDVGMNVCISETTGLFEVLLYKALATDSPLPLFRLKEVLKRACVSHTERQISFCTSIFLGYAVVHLVEALHYKPEGRGFDSRWCHWNVSLT